MASFRKSSAEPTLFAHLYTETELVCQSCRQIFPSSSLLSEHVLPSPYDKSYSYTCAPCLDGEPTLLHTQKSWFDLASTVLFNLSLKNHQRFFSDKDIKGFLKEFPQVCPSRFSGSIRPLLSEMESRSDVFEFASVNGTWALKLKPDSNESLDSVEESSQDESVMELEKTEKPQSKRSKDRNEEPKSKNLKQKLFQWCHQCKQKHDYVFHCSQDCNKKYCAKCLHRHYNEKESEIDPDNWVCVYCRQLCCCAFCRKKKAKATDTKFESRRGKKRNLALSGRNKVKRRKLNETQKEEQYFFDTESSIDQSSDGQHDEEIEDEDAQTTHLLKLEVTTGTPDIVPVFRQIQVANLYKWLKNDFMNSQDIIHGSPGFDEHLPLETFHKNQQKTKTFEKFFVEEDFVAVDGFQEFPVNFAEDIDMKRDDTSSSTVWADSLLW